MKHILSTIATLLLYTATASAQQVNNVFGFPATEPGYSLGVSACYAGEIGDWLIVAGGCNFPTPGNKTYYAGIYAAHIDDSVLNWRLVGMLPEPAAYGATIASGDSLLFIGGNNKEHGLNTVYSIHINGNGSEAKISRMADMPVTVDNMAAAKSGDKAFIVGGNQGGKPSTNILCLNLKASNKQWSTMASIPGEARVQPVSAACEGKLYVWGGFFADGEKSIVHTDGYGLDTNSGTWSKLAAPRSINGTEMTLSGGIAWSEGNRIIATGGVNKEIFLDAISGRYELVKQTEYLKQPIDWYKFSGNLYEFDTTKDEWMKTTFANKGLARAGAQAVPTSTGCYYIGGELKPAVRTPQIVVLKGE